MKKQLIAAYLLFFAFISLATGVVIAQVQIGPNPSPQAAGSRCAAQDQNQDGLCDMCQKPVGSCGQGARCQAGQCPQPGQCGMQGRSAGRGRGAQDGAGSRCGRAAMPMPAATK